MKKDTLGSIVLLTSLILSGVVTLNLYVDIPVWILMFVVIFGLCVFVYVFLKSKDQES